MIKRRGTMLILVSLVFGGLAAWAANNWLNTQLLAGESSENMDVVVAAAMEIPYGTKVESRHLTTVELPAGTMPEGAFNDEAMVEGKVARVDIKRGELLLSERFADHDTGSTLAALVSPRMRAITVRVDDVIGVAGFLLPGNRVDVLATKLDQRTRNAKTETILTNLKVLAVDQTAATDKNEPVIVRAVTLEMMPEQSEALVKAKEEGTIQLTLRNPLEQVAAVTPKAKPVAPQRPVVRSAPRQPTSTAVTIIRGTRVDKTKAKI